MKVAMISDTHNLLRGEVKEQLHGCDLILHAGDVCSPAVYDTIADLGKPMLTVRGNNDGRWAAEKGIPKVLDIRLSEVKGISGVVEGSKMQNLRIYMVHDRKDIPAEVLEGNTEYDLVVFGHSHKYESFYAGKTLVINPGSCGPMRFRLPVTMAVAEICDLPENTSDKFRLRRIDFAKEKQTAEVREITPGEMKMIVIRVVKDIRRNKSVEQIARKHKISPELAQQICRLYLTHPGVTIDGILGKMGI